MAENKVDLTSENNARKKIEANNKKDEGGAGKPLQSIDHDKPPSGKSPVGPMDGELMNWTQMLENIAAIQTGIQYAAGENDIMDSNVSDSGVGGQNDDELLQQLNQIFTPILVMQGFEGEIADRVQEAYSEANVLVERNIIKFDDATRMGQLISVCALLIARQKNTQQWQMYKQAAQIRKSMKLEIQKLEQSAAQALAQKFLVKVSTTNDSSVARNAATNLLPSTQH